MDAAKQIDNRIAELDDWRGKVMAQLRRIVHEAAPEIVEEWKWDTPVFSQNGNVVAIGTFQDHVKLNFFKGASLEDPHRSFNAGLEAKATRSIDIREGDRINEADIKVLIRAAVALNSSKAKPAKKVKKSGG